MTRLDAVKWKPLIDDWVNGAELWYLYTTGEWVKVEEIFFETLDDIKIVVKDEHFEARKAYAVGLDIEMMQDFNGKWEPCDNPNWEDKETEFRVKSNEWYDNIPEGGAICWAWNDNEKKKRIAIVYGVRDDTASKFITEYDNCFDNARPIDPSECMEITK